jgi:hypothetical protein
MPAFAAKGHSETQAVSVVVWFGPAQVLGRLLHLAFGRGLPARRLGIVVMCGLPMSLAIFAMASSLAGLLAFCVLFGFVNGLVTIVRGSIVPEFFGREHVGRISGTMAAIALLARAVAPLAAAWLLLALPDYGEMLGVLCGVGVAALATFALARHPRRAVRPGS